MCLDVCMLYISMCVLVFREKMKPNAVCVHTTHVDTCMHATHNYICLHETYAYICFFQYIHACTLVSETPYRVCMYIFSRVCMQATMICQRNNHSHKHAHIPHELGPLLAHAQNLYPSSTWSHILPNCIDPKSSDFLQQLLKNRLFCSQNSNSSVVCFRNICFCGFVGTQSLGIVPQYSLTHALNTCLFWAGRRTRTKPC